MFRGRLASRLPHHRLPDHRAPLSSGTGSARHGQCGAQRSRRAAPRSGAVVRWIACTAKYRPGEGLAVFSGSRIVVLSGPDIPSRQGQGAAQQVLRHDLPAVDLTGIGASLFAILTANSLPVAVTAGATAAGSFVDRIME
jgi:hypothetical protein